MFNNAVPLQRNVFLLKYFVGYRLWLVGRSIKNNESEEKRGLVARIANFKRNKIRGDNEDNFILYSARSSFFSPELTPLWLPNEPIEAHCIPSLDGSSREEFPESQHDAPSLDCKCGINGFRSKEQLEKYIRSLNIVGNASGIGSLVAGSVAIWGRFIELDDGWRTQYGYPLSIESAMCVKCLRFLPYQEVEFTKFNEETRKEIHRNVESAMSKAKGYRRTSWEEYEKKNIFPYCIVCNDCRDTDKRERPYAVTVGSGSGAIQQINDLYGLNPE